MDQKQFVEFIKANCDRAYQHYLKNRKLERAGWALFGVGLALSAGVGTGLFIAGDWDHKGYYSSPLMNAGLAFWSIGAAMGIGAGIPMICVGNVRKKNSHEQYNRWCGDRDQASNMEMRLTFGANGLGLALAF